MKYFSKPGGKYYNNESAKKLGITTTTLYMYVNGDGSLKEEGKKVYNSCSGT